MMADNGGDDDDIFVYTGGEQRVPRDIKRVRIAENVDTIPGWTFTNCEELREVEGHKKIKKIERLAFCECPSLRSVRNMTGVEEIEDYAFGSCFALSELELDKLEIIGNCAFVECNSLRSINLPSIRRVGRSAFNGCDGLTDVMFGKDLYGIEGYAFNRTALRSISIPLKDNLIIDNHAFHDCENLSRADVVVGEINTIISSLHMESWRDQMLEEIDSINQTLPNALSKTRAIREWITRVPQRMEHYKSEHKIILKEAMTLLELALWKAKLLNEADEKKCKVDVVKTKKAKVDTEAAKKEHRVTCGASVVIKNVLPFLALK